jgi:GntR family transcriptional regulator/MocR family aminotransferase
VRRAQDSATTNPRLSKRGSLLVHSGAGFLPSGAPGPVPFELGIPALDAFPWRLWSRVAGRHWRRGDVELGEADPAGERPLREAIADYLTTARDAHCTADQVLVTNGAQQAMHLIAQALLDPGEAAWIEDPGYIGARTALQVAGARLVPVAVDAEGLDVSAGERAAPDARLAYVTPSHQFPLGVLMSAPRRLQLLSWARRSSAWIVEDDYDSEFRYAGRPLPCLQGLDAQASPAGESHRVLYVGTFSKTLAPGLRLGYLVVPDALVDAFRAVRAATDRHTPTLDQSVLAELIGEGHYGRHIRQVRNLCAERQAALLSAAESRLTGVLTLAPDPAGLHLVARLASGIDENRAAQLATADRIPVSPLSRFMMGDRTAAHPPALLLGYAAYDERQIRSGVERLARALERA